MPTLAKKEECTGCSACTNICPKKCLQMEIDKEGFLYPFLKNTEACVECGMCGMVCPVHGNLEIQNVETQAYAAYTKDSDIRKSSSSGGIFSELGLQVLNQGGAVYGAAYGTNYHVEHICIENVDNLERLRGAKYAQCRLNDSFSIVKERLNSGQQVLFSGTPCQVAGLKAFLQKNYPNLLTVDFVCHGVSSPAAWNNYVRYRANLDNEGTLPVKINLRSKDTGWSRYQYSNKYQYADGKTYSARSGTDLYMKLFVGDYINRMSCADCHFKGYNRVSDITLGDFWGIWDVVPEMDDDKGTSLVLLHSERGKIEFDKLSGRIQSKKVTLEQASASNPSLLYSSPAKPEREDVLQAVLNGDMELASGMIQTAGTKANFGQRVLDKVKGMVRILGWRK